MLDSMEELELDSSVSVENVPAEEMARLLASTQGFQLSDLEMTGKGRSHGGCMIQLRQHKGQCYRQ